MSTIHLTANTRWRSRGCRWPTTSIWVTHEMEWRISFRVVTKWRFDCRTAAWPFGGLCSIRRYSESVRDEKIKPLIVSIVQLAEDEESKKVNNIVHTSWWKNTLFLHYLVNRFSTAYHYYTFSSTHGPKPRHRDTQNVDSWWVSSRWIMCWLFFLIGIF